MPLVTHLQATGEQPEGYEIDCPGCGNVHFVPKASPQNGLAAFAAQREIMSSEEVNGVRKVCHAYLTDELIEFQEDCTHNLAGMLVDATGMVLT